MKRIHFFLLIIFIQFASSINAQQLSFPGAEGYGRYALGGRGGSVYFVTNLNDAGPGSLRNGLAAGNRTILFSVSGTIYLSSQLNISKPNTTIAGQSAPGDGICLANYSFRVEASNVIVRYIRCRLGDLKKYADDAMDGNGTSPTVTRTNIIIDHCSMSWSLDEASSFYDNKNFTMQWCIISESLYHSYHPKGDHGYGGIWGGQGASFHHNLLAHHTSRNPRFCGSRYTGDSLNEIVDFRNNVIYNWGSTNTAYGGEAGNYNMVNNYYRYGPATPNSSLRYRILQYTSYYYATDAQIYPDTVWGGKFYVNGNYVYGYPATTADNWNGGGTRPGVQKDSYAGCAALMAKNKLLTEIPVAPVTTQTAQQAYISVVSGAGAILPARDSNDLRIAREARDGTATYNGTYNSSQVASGIIDTQGNVGGWPTLNSKTPPTDTDGDGMPDEWETQRNLNAANASDRNNFTANGYTNLENYLNGDSIIAVGTVNTCLNAKTIYSSNSGVWLNAKDTTFTRLICTDTMNVIASIWDNANLGAINVSYYRTNTTRLTGLSQPYLNRNVTISSVNPLTSSIKVRLYITNAEFYQLTLADATVTTIADVKVLYIADNNCATAMTGTPARIIPVDAASWGTYQTGYYIEFYTSNLGTFFFGSSAILVPLKLISFDAKQIKEQQVNLSWTTENEINTAQFIIDRSINGKDFASVGTITAKGSSANYSFNDPLTTNYSLLTTLYYRLKMMDKDGSYKYSKVVALSIMKNNTGFNILRNPVTDELDFITIDASLINTEASIINNEGLVVKRFIIKEGTQKISVAQLGAGIYYISTQKGNKKLMIQR